MCLKDRKASEPYRKHRGGKEAEQHRRGIQLVGEGQRRMLAYARPAARPPGWRQLEWQDSLLVQ